MAESSLALRFGVAKTLGSASWDCMPRTLLIVSTVVPCWGYL